MWNPKNHLLQLTQSLRNARSVELPKDPAAAKSVLLPMVFGNQYKSIGDLLIRSNFDVNYSFGRAQRTLLHIAANCGHWESIVTLLKHGSNVDFQDISGSTALHLAAKNGKKKCVEKLLENGASPDLQSTDGSTAMHWLATNGHHEILKVILMFTSQINMEDCQGHTPLHAAARNGHSKAMECLISAGANINYSNSARFTPLHAACSNGQRDAISTLISHNVKLQLDNNGLSPLALCIQGGFGVAAVLIIQCPGCNIQDILQLCLMDTKIELTKIVSCFKFFSSSSIAISLAEKMTQLVVDLGYQLLSPGSNSQNLINCIQRASKLNLILWKSENSPDSRKQVSKDLFCTFQPLWKSVEEWLVLLKNEINSESNTFNATSNNLMDCMHQRLSAIIWVYQNACAVLDSYSIRDPLSAFSTFFEKNVDVFKRFILIDPKIIFQHFEFLLQDKYLVRFFLEEIKAQPFSERYCWFYENLCKPELSLTERNVIQVNRHAIFEDSCSYLKDISTDILKENFSVQFKNEEGMGDGVLREWLHLLSSEILNPQYGLFTPSADGCLFQPNRNSSVNPDHLTYFKFAGQILGLALYRHTLVNFTFTSSFYKHILGIKVDYMDVASIDPEYAKNLQWILDNDISDLGLELTFAVETDVFGVMQKIELIENGSNISVTQENKSEYVQLVTELRMTHAIQPQITAFRQGFNEFIPESLLQIFSEDELQVMLAGSPKLDIDTWKSITTYTGCYDENSQIVQSLWKCITLMSEEQRANLLLFVTSSSRLPPIFLSHHSNKFVVFIDPGNKHLLPTASTCMNMLKLPEYDTFEELQQKLLVAIECGRVGYSYT